MKTFSLSQRPQVAQYVSNLKQDAYNMDMHCVIVVAREAIAQVVNVSYAFFSDFLDAEQSMKSITMEKNAQDYTTLLKGQSATPWVVYLDGKIFSNNVDFGWVE